MQYSDITIEIAREAFRQRIAEENELFKKIDSNAESRCSTRVALESHKTLLSVLKTKTEKPA